MKIFRRCACLFLPCTACFSLPFRLRINSLITVLKTRQADLKCENFRRCACLFLPCTACFSLPFRLRINSRITALKTRQADLKCENIPSMCLLIFALYCLLLVAVSASDKRYILRINKALLWQMPRQAFRYSVTAS